MIPSNRTSIHRAFLGFSGVLLLLFLMVGTSAWTWGHRSGPSSQAEGQVDVHEFEFERDSLIGVVKGLRKKVDALKGNDASKLLAQMEEERLWLSNYVEQYASITSAGAMRSFAGKEANKPPKSMDDGMLALKAQLEGALLGRTLALEQARATRVTTPSSSSFKGLSDGVPREQYEEERNLRTECEERFNVKGNKLSLLREIARTGKKSLGIDSVEKCEPNHFSSKRKVDICRWDNEQITILIEQYRRFLVELSKD